MAQKNYTSINDLIGRKKHHKISAGLTKEVESAETTQERYEVKESVEYEPEEEVRVYIQPRKETIKLPPDLKKMGVQAASSTNFPSYQTVVLPISDDKVLQGLHAPISSSLRWLATLAWYLLRKAHLTLKVIHGHVVRVIKG